MKKILALLLAVVMVLGLFAACAESKPDNTDPNNVQNADDIPDEMTSEDG